MTNAATISSVLDEFLQAQQERLAPRTFATYGAVIGLLRSFLDTYGYQSLSETEHQQWQAAYDAGDEEAFCRLFGPQQILDGMGEFLGYFMVRKVIAGQELLRGAGTVTKKLAGWMAEQGYVNPGAAGVAVGMASEATRDLPRAERLARQLEEVRRTRLDPATLDALDDEDYIEDYLMIERVEPGALWFEGRIGSVPVPESAAELAQPGWSITLTLARSAGRWHIVEVGNVYP
jgi:hypothetical protein